MLNFQVIEIYRKKIKLKQDEFVKEINEEWDILLYWNYLHYVYKDVAPRNQYELSKRILQVLNKHGKKLTIIDIIKK